MLCGVCADSLLVLGADRVQSADVMCSDASSRCLLGFVSSVFRSKSNLSPYRPKTSLSSGWFHYFFGDHHG